MWIDFGRSRRLVLTPSRFCGGLAALMLAAALALPAEGASVYLSRLAFRVLATPHFRIYFHQGGESEARRLAAIAEAVCQELAARTRLAPPRVTHVVLANQDDDPNGLATSLPYPTVRIAAAWPATSDLIGNADDWLRTVFIHEYTHVLQFERAVGWAKVARALLGRSPISFPNLFLPRWQIEGYATYWESRMSELGRLNGGDSRAIVTEQGRAGALPMDKANGGLVEWPGGNEEYLEGAWFYDYLVSRFGEEAVGRLSNVTAGWLPYLSAPAFRGVFNASLGSLWRDFQTQVVSGARRPAVSGRVLPTRVTDRGYWVSSPRFDASGAHIVYFLRDPEGFPSVREIDTAPPVRAGATGQSHPTRVPAPRTVVDRAGGRFLAVRNGEVFFDEVELRENVARRSDLRLADLATGRTQALSSDARLLEPDVSSDGRMLACVRVTEEGTRALAFYSVERGAGGRTSLVPASVPVQSAPGTTYGAPRWSPDGRRLAAEQRQVGGASALVVFDVADGSARVVARSSGGRVMTAAWMPDSRQLLFASDGAGTEFQIYATTVAGGPVRQVTAVSGGASFPDVSPDGTTLAFVGSGPAGHDVFTLPLDPASWSDAPLMDDGAAQPPAVRPVPPLPTNVAAHGYSPIPTLLPRSWTPLADTQDGDIRLGFGLAGNDVLVRHAYAVSVLWRTAPDNGTGVPRTRPDWSASYAYDRWRPSFYVSASDKTSLLEIVQAQGRPPVPAALREEQFASGVALSFQKVRHQQVVLAEYNAARNTTDAHPVVAGGVTTAVFRRSNRNALRSAWALNTAKQYGRSISTEEGVSAAVTSEQVRTALGADGNADAFTGEVRAYWRPLSAHAVLAARAGYGTSAGDVGVRRAFYLGGSLPAGPLINFGSDELRMLRGFDEGVSAGYRTAVSSVEWRQPLLRVERGWGTVPVFLRTIHGAVFVDAGEAWTSSFKASRVKTSVGAEGSIDIVAGFGLPLTLTTGVAWTRDGGAGGRTGTAVYFRMGPSF